MSSFARTQNSSFENYTTLKVCLLDKAHWHGSFGDALGQPQPDQRRRERFIRTVARADWLLPIKPRATPHPMKRIALTLALLASAALSLARAEDLKWLTSLPDALKEAKEAKKAVMINFTGSDWCPWCVRMDKEVFNTPEFAKYAKENLVLVMLDYPRKKELAAELKKANAELKTKYEIKGFPTYILLSGDGKELDRQVGYLQGSLKAFAAKLDGFKAK
jgi:thioredoxin-related protein